MISKFNPFKAISIEQATAILEQGTIKGHPISAKQEMYLREIAGNVKQKPIEKSAIICDHPDPYILTTVSGRKVCRKCYKEI